MRECVVLALMSRLSHTKYQPMSITEAILCIVTMYSNIMFRLAMITSFGRASRQRGAERALVLLRANSWQR